MEKFFTEYEHTIGAISAFATAAAVIVSLWVTVLGANAHRTKITANASIRLIVVGEIPKEQWPHYLVISITNIGLMRAKLDSNFMYWKLPMGRHSLLIIPHDSYGDTYVPRKAYPLFVEPNESVTIFATKLADFEGMFTEKFVGKGVRRFFARFMFPRVMTVDGRTFRVKMDNQVKKIIDEGTRVFGKK